MGIAFEMALVALRLADLSRSAAFLNCRPGLMREEPPANSAFWPPVECSAAAPSDVGALARSTFAVGNDSDVVVAMDSEAVRLEGHPLPAT